MSGRPRVLLIDRIGYDRYRGPDGEPPLDPSRYDVTLVTPPALVGQARPGECVEVVGVDVLAGRVREPVCRALHEAHRFDRLLVFTERLLEAGGRMRAELGIPGPGPAEVTPLRDKAAMKRVAERAGLPVADWRPVTRPEDALPLLHRHGRIVVKPVDGTGSVGIADCATEDDVRAVWARDPGFTGLAEQRIDDEMLHVDAIAAGGRLLLVNVSRYLVPTTVWSRGEPLYSVMVGDEALRRAAAEMCEQVVDAFGLGWSVVHLEVFHRAGRLVFSEVAGRAGGAGIGTAVRAVTGFSLYDAMVRVALGETPRPRYAPSFPHAGWALVYSREGLVSRFDDSAVPREWLVERSVSIHEGEWAKASWIAGGGAVKYVVGGRDEAEVTERLREAVARCHIEYADDPDRPAAQGRRSEASRVAVPAGAGDGRG